MRSFLRSVNLASAPKSVDYESALRVESKAVPGVTFSILRVSFGRRLELGRRIRDLSRKAEYLEAGATDEEKIDASLLGYDIERIWLEWNELAGLDPEARLSQLARWVVEAERGGFLYGLRLPGFEAPPARGTDHRTRLLRELALYPAEEKKN